MRAPLKLALAAAAFVLIALAFPGDDAPPQDSDLRPVVAAVPDADNAWTDFEVIRAAHDATVEEIRFLGMQLDGITDAPRVEKLIARNARAMAAFRSFGRRKAFQDPVTRDPASIGPSTPMPSFLGVVTAARLCLLHADLLHKSGRASEALDETLAVLDAGRVLVGSNQPFLTQLVGGLLLERASSRALKLVKSGRLPKPRLLEAARRFSTPTGLARGYQDGFRFDYMLGLFVVDHIRTYAIGDFDWMNPSPIGRLVFRAQLALARWSFIFMPERTKAHIARRVRLRIEAAAMPCSAVKMPDDHVSMGLRNTLGNRFLGYGETGSRYQEKLLARRCAVDFRVARAGVAAALESFRSERGRYPTELGMLAPRWLPAVPVDPFTGGAIAYSPETGELRTDGKDSEGKPL